MDRSAQSVADHDRHFGCADHFVAGVDGQGGAVGISDVPHRCARHRLDRNLRNERRKSQISTDRKGQKEGLEKYQHFKATGQATPKWRYFNFTLFVRSEWL